MDDPPRIPHSPICVISPTVWLYLQRSCLYFCVVFDLHTQHVGHASWWECIPSVQPAALLDCMICYEPCSWLNLSLSLSLSLSLVNVTVHDIRHASMAYSKHRNAQPQQTITGMPPRSTFCHRTITDSITRIVFGGAGTGEIHRAQYRPMQHRPLTMWSPERAATRTSPAAILSLWSPWTNAITSMSRPPTKSCDAAMI